MSLPNVSVIIIGKDEEKNLFRTFQSVQTMNYPDSCYETIYVDTGSKDGSIDIAKQFTNRIYFEKNPWSTPGLARNRGIMEANYDIVHLLDGDIEIHPDYLAEAVGFLQSGDAEAFFGYLTERHGGINQVLLSHWEKKKRGFVSTSGGGGTYLRKPLMKINGYDERIRKGQEIELGERFIKSGYRIWYEPIPMGIHNYDVHNLRSMLRIPYIAGKSMAYSAMLDSGSDYVLNQKQMSKRNIFFNASFYFFLLFVFISIYPFLLFLSFFLIYLSYKFVKARAFRSPKTFKYHLVNSTYRFIMFWGQIHVLYGIYISQNLDKPGVKQVINA